MKQTLSIILILSLTLALAACGNGDMTTPSVTNATKPTQSTQPTEPSAQPTDPTDAQVGMANTAAAGLLKKIWDSFGEGERFSAYGGTVEHSVENAPGDLDMKNTQELITKYMIPEAQLANLEEGASLVHLMNSNIFTGSAFRLKENADAKTVAKALRDNIQSTEWICGQPDRMAICHIQGHLVMAFGEQELMQGFQTKLTQVYPDAQVLYNEAVTE